MDELRDGSGGTAGSSRPEVTPQGPRTPRGRLLGVGAAVAVAVLALVVVSTGWASHRGLGSLVVPLALLLVLNAVISVVQYLRHRRERSG